MATRTPPFTVKFEDTSLLQLGGEWISSAFYFSGYRLHLVMKSTKMDRSLDYPTEQERIKKLRLQLAVMAVDRGANRQWPCEGTVTVRFNYSQQRNPSFSVDFSIREPVAELKSQRSLPVGLVLRWTDVPQDCNPFYLEYDPPPIFSRQKHLFPASMILHNFTSEVVVEIENAQIAVKGIKRALDVLPPQATKKLELESESESTSVAPSSSRSWLTLAGTADTVEYRTMISCTSKLMTAVSGELVGLSGRLLAKGLISRHNYEEFLNRSIEASNRAARLVELIQQKVELDPQNYFKFIGILKEDSRYYSDILNILNRTYHSQEGSRVMKKEAPVTVTFSLLQGLELGKSYADVDTSTTESGLRGVDVCGEASLTVTNKAQQFIWKNFGLRLTIPSGVLPPDVDKCDLLIKASLSGNYQFPRKYHLVSPIFWIHCKPNCKLAKPITLEVQHCALDKNISKLSFVKASCTQKELPYSFEIISGGKFSTNSSYGLVELKHFSGIGAAQEGTEDREYCARLFYLTNSIHDRQVHFTITWNIDAHRNVTEEHYAKLHGTPGPEQEIDFEADAVTLDIPERGGATEESWKIVPLMRPRVTKKQVDSFKEGKRIPHCELLWHV